MEIKDFTFFILISIGVIAVPGPNVLVIISTSLVYGTKKGLQTVAGTSVAMSIQLLLAGMGTSWFVGSFSTGFLILKWVGVAYLVYLGITHMIMLFATSQNNTDLTGIGSFRRGFWVSLSNPKTILFFGAFLPQYTNSYQSYGQQIFVYSISFWMLAILLDSCYAMFSGRFSQFLHTRKLNFIQDGMSGVLFLGAAMLLSLKSIGA